MFNFGSKIRVWHLGALGVAVLVLFLALSGPRLDEAGASIIAISFGIISIGLPLGLWLEENAHHKMLAANVRGSLTTAALTLCAMLLLFGAAGIFVAVAATQRLVVAENGVEWRVAAPVLCLLCSQIAYVAWAATFAPNSDAAEDQAKVAVPRTSVVIESASSSKRDLPSERLKQSRVQSTDTEQPASEPPT